MEIKQILLIAVVAVVAVAVYGKFIAPMLAKQTATA